MTQAIKEIFITFIALYLLVIFSGILNTSGYIFEQNSVSSMRSCEMENSNKACACCSSGESANEGCKCSMNNKHSHSDSNESYVKIKCNCMDQPTLHSNFIVLKFVVTSKADTSQYPNKNQYSTIKSNYSQYFISSIDHPPSIFFS